MLKLSQSHARTCQGISRRDFLRIGGLSTLGLSLGLQTAQAYIAGPPTTLGKLITMSDHVMVARVEEVKEIDRDRGAVIYRQVRHIKGTWPSDVVRHLFN